MPKEPLDGRQVHARADEPRRERVPQRVRRDVLAADAVARGAEQEVDAVVREVPEDPRGPVDRDGAVAEDGGERRLGQHGQRDCPRAVPLAAFAADRHRRDVPRHLVPPQIDRLVAAESGLPHQDDDRADLLGHHRVDLPDRVRGKVRRRLLVHARQPLARAAENAVAGDPLLYAPAQKRGERRQPAVERRWTPPALAADLLEGAHDVVAAE